MKASPRHQQLLLELQSLDTHKLRLNRRHKQLPERAELEAIAERQREVRANFMRAQRTVEEARGELQRVEEEVATVEQRHQRSSERLAASTQAKEASAFQEELDTLVRRRGVLEERQLELMEQAEAAEGQFTLSVVDVSDVDAEVQRLRDAIHQAEQQIAEELAALDEERAGLAAEVQGPVLEVYERTRERYGIGAARLRGTVSEGSNMELDPADLQTARNTPADELFFCPTSGAILVRDAAE